MQFLNSSSAFIKATINIVVLHLCMYILPISYTGVTAYSATAGGHIELVSN